MDSSRFFHPYAAGTAARDERIAQANAVCNICPALMAWGMPSIPGLCERIELVVAIWSVRLAAAVLFDEAANDASRRCGVAQHVSRPNQPIRISSSQTIVDPGPSTPWPREWPAPIRDSHDPPRTAFTATTSVMRATPACGHRPHQRGNPAPRRASPELRPVTVTDIPPERNTIFPMPPAGADGTPQPPWLPVRSNHHSNHAVSNIPGLAAQCQVGIKQERHGATRSYLHEHRSR